MSEKQNDELSEAFKYLYQTYFGESQIEKDEIERLPELLANCDVFIDVGASLGMYTHFANLAMSNATIYAIEADPDRFEELKANCEKWSEDSDNTLLPIFAAAGDSTSPISFYKTGTHISGGLFELRDRADEFVKVTVPQILLDDFFDPDKNFFAKIDVEGAELRVLEGAQQLIESRRTEFAVAIHSWGDKERGKTPLSVLRFMFTRRMTISKTTTSKTSNYLFSPSKRWLRRLASYARCAPFLLCRQWYRKFFPFRLRRMLERRLNQSRRETITQNGS